MSLTPDSSPRLIYLDHHATSPCDPEVLSRMLPFFGDAFGNASSPHHTAGARARDASERARRQVARHIGGHPREVVFTSGATEALNLGMLGLLEGSTMEGKEIIVSAVEHAAVLDTCHELERRGVKVHHLPVDGQGRVALKVLSELCSTQTALVCVMMANNEVGTVQDLEAISTICRASNIPLMSDCVQSAMWLPIDVNKLGLDMLAISGHKMGGPQGVGALWVRRCSALRGLRPRQFGGGQERGLRAGTLPIPLVVGLGAACELASERLRHDAVRVSKLRDTLWRLISQACPDATQNGALDSRLPNNLNLTLPGIQAEALLRSVPGLAASSGAACSAERLEPSHVLKAMGLSDAQIYSSVRFGLGRSTGPEEIEEAAQRIVDTVSRLRGVT